MPKFSKILFLVLTVLSCSSLTLNNTWAVQNNSATWNNVFDCVKAAYEKEGKNVSDYGITSSNYGSKAVASVVSACNVCLNNNKHLGASQSAAWFNKSSSNSYLKDAIFDQATDDSLVKGKVYGVDSSDTVDIYLRVAGLLCGIEDVGNPIARQFINLQYSENNSNDNNGRAIAGSCPEGTTRKAPSGSTLPNCNNDGYNKGSFTPNAPVTNNTLRDTYYPPYTIPNDTGNQNRKSLSYLNSAIAYNDSNVLRSGSMVSYGWSSTGGNTQKVVVNIKKFKNDSAVTKTRPDGKHYVNYTQMVYIFGCVPNAYPGMSLNISEGISWFYGCRTHKSKLFMRFYDPILTLKAVDTEGNSLSSVIKDKVVYGDEAEIKEVSITRRTKTGYIFKGFATSLANAKDGKFVTATDSNNNTRHYVSGTKSVKETFHNIKLSENKTRYAVYLNANEIENMLVADAAKEDGTILEANIDSDSAGYNENATVDRREYSTPTGYTFRGWREKANTGDLTTGNTYTTKLTGSDKKIFAIYSRNSFKGEAKATKNGTTTSTTTGFVDTSKTASNLEITSCDSSGCKVDFELNIQRVGAGGSTDYYVEKKINNGQWLDIPTDEGEFSGSSSGGNVFKITKTLSPGQTMCYRLTFNPRGVHENNYEATVAVCAEAVKSFEGLARVAEGTAMVDEATKNTTGWVNEDATAQPNPLSVGCGNDGCQVRFVLSIKKKGAGGTTAYTIQKKVDNGDWGDIPVDEGGATGNSPGVEDGSTHHNVFKITKKLNPGQQMCYRLTFKPYGDKSSSTTATVTTCAKADLSKFQGMSRVGSGSSSGWYESGYASKSASAAYYTIDNCDDGCSAKFEHYLKRTEGTGSTQYRIRRIINKSGSYAVNEKIEEFSGISNGSGKKVNTYTKNNLYPGDKVCEYLYFRPNNSMDTSTNPWAYSASYVSTKACVLALGKWQPGGPDDPGSSAVENASFLNIKVKNKTLGGDYKNDYVYGKPGDEIVWRAKYEPTLQSRINMVPERIGINMSSSSDWLSNSFENSDNNLIYVLFNQNKGSNLGYWNNAFSVKRGFASNSLINYCRDTSECFAAAENITPTNKYEVGNSENRWELNSYNDYRTGGISNSEVGRKLSETALTNASDLTTSTPSQVIFRAVTDSDGKMWNIGNVITRTITASAEAMVPYNFGTGARVVDEQKPIYAGEENEIKIEIDIKPKHNNLTMKDGDENYATKASEKWKVIIYSGDESGGWVSGEDQSDLCSHYYPADCSYSKEGSGTLNNYSTLSDMFKTSVNSRTLSFYAQDLAAGSKLCFAAAVYPASSGADDNLSSTGDKKWRVSESKCYPIAKRPSLQVWGGNIYSAGNITTGVSKKKNLAGSASGDGYYIFGSWGELGVIASGTIKGMASGTSTGYATNNNGTLAPRYTFKNGGSTASYNGNGNNGLGVSPGGTSEGTINYCLRGILSFANNSCNGSSGFTGKITDANTVKGNVSDDKNNIINSFGSKTRYDVVDDTINLPRNVEERNEAEVNGVHYRKGGNLIISSSTVDAGTTYVAEANNIMISGNLIYGGQYQTLEGVPKIIIYAENNIYINCNVERIDALLVAKTVVTCGNDFNMSLSDSNIVSGINNLENSVQLMMNGAIIANKLIANRTYGAATGANSMISAEIINFDNTLYLWGSRRSEANTSVKLTDAYTREISPRS